MHWSVRLIGGVGIPVEVSNLEAVIVLEVELVKFDDGSSSVVSTEQVHSRAIPWILMQESWSLFVPPIRVGISILIIPLDLVPWRGVAVVGLIVDLQDLLVIVHDEGNVVIGLLVTSGHVMVDSRVGLEPRLVSRCGADLLDRDKFVNITSSWVQLHNDRHGVTSSK